MMRRLVAVAVIALARLVTAVRGAWVGCGPDPSRPRVYFANHRSHGDFVLVWTVMPPPLRRVARPVAAADYWQSGRLRPFVARAVFNAVLIERGTALAEGDPIGRMTAALEAGESLILFPEGTRNTTEEPLLSFKSGLYHLAKARPDTEFVPVWIENLHRVMPKGELLPVPLLCSVTFGVPLTLAAGENRGGFTQRARAALLDLGRSRAAL
ncbi:MAG: 1-acyl-sn-glycerol-3-phosphate acyltransferase [Alphaproteobacteria bacterium]|nr:1-acyl-sn-glycerol-3-phosphate acyltransferase [Alphaproteobacteria bacterium]